MSKHNKVIKNTMWNIEHPILFKLKYLFTEKTKLANWEVYIIIIACMLLGLLLGFIMGIGKIP